MSDAPKFSGKSKHRKLKIYNMIKEFEALNTQQILSMINKNNRYGMTMNELSSTLGTMYPKHLKHLGFCDYKASYAGARVRCVIWGIRK